MLTDEKIEEIESKAFDNAVFQTQIDEKDANICVYKIYSVHKNQGFSDIRLVNDESYRRFNMNRFLFIELINNEELEKEDNKFLRRLNEQDINFLNSYVAYGRYALKKFELNQITNFRTHPKATSAYAKLCKNIVGQENVKKVLCRLNSVYQYAKKRSEYQLNTEDVHKVLAFIGPPGTGKTTAAGYFAAMMQEGGLLQGNKIICVTGTQLKAGYIGQTSTKVHKIFQDNDIIIIDEAYSLVNYNITEKTDSFAQEALAQLCVEVEEHSKDKMIIFAGYGGSKNEKYNKMEKFMNENPGISSRITFTVNFEAYDVDTMLKIFELLASNNSFKLQEGWEKILKPLFEYRINKEDFGNGREARRLLEIAMTYAAEEFIDWSYETDFKSDEERKKSELKKLMVLKCRYIEDAIKELYGDYLS